MLRAFTSANVKFIYYSSLKSYFFYFTYQLYNTPHIPLSILHYILLKYYKTIIYFYNFSHTSQSKFTSNHHTSTPTPATHAPSRWPMSDSFKTPDNHNIHHKSNTNLQPYSQINHKSSTHTHKSTTNLQPIPTNQTQMNLIPNSHFHELFIPKNQIEKHQLHNLFIPTNQIKKPLNP